ncbi:MAG: NAD(+)/NADH kinase [Oscillospiraceae bacterium]|nr:NAD(+)/NADH kinase [Oscillospiraceae bacterium]
MKVILSSNPYRDRGFKAALQAQKILESSGVECCFCMPFEISQNSRLELPSDIEFKSLQEQLSQADMLICFGGDGTILHAAKDAASHHLPILGVNMGSVGFMAELEESELHYLEQIARNKYTIDKRMMLQVRLMRGKQVVYDELALNDAVISKGSIARVVELDVAADGVHTCQLSGDGVVVATPTGSTAYSMSAGGPIIEPSSQTLVVTPVCAHQLSARSIVMSSDRTITVQMPRRSKKSVYLSVDGGKATRIMPTDRVEIRRAASCTQLVRLTGKNFYELLNKKLGGRQL